jgi:hypothetical protein
MSEIIKKVEFGFDWINEVATAKVERSQLLGDDISKFVFGGNATFTVVNTDTNKWFTFKVRQPKGNKDVSFVSVLTGSENGTSYSFLGTFFSKGQVYRRSKKSSIGSDAQSAKVISWFFKTFINNEEKYPTVQVFHDGKCGACGRKLTTPQSVKSGLGPVCGGKNR